MQLRGWILIVLLLAADFLKAQNNADVINYINTYKSLAIEEEERAGVPAAITLAQGIHETMAGKSDLVQQSNNHFGIKCKSNWDGDKVYHDDDARAECFRSYASAADSYRDHSDFLRNSPRYAFLFKINPTDYKDWAYGLKKAGYATNTQYSKILIELIEDYNLEQYTLIAIGKLSPDQEILAGSTRADDNSLMPDPDSASADESPNYPQGSFEINRTKVIYAKAGTSLLAIAQQYEVPLTRLIDFNDMPEEEVLIRGQLIFLHRKRKVGANEVHIVRPGETLYNICQSEGIRLESLENYNRLEHGEQPAVGEKLFLQSQAAARPRLVGDTEIIAQSETVAPTPDNIINQDAKPDTITHIVQNKETLYRIARQYGVDVEQIRTWNHLNGYDLKPGQELVIYKN